MAEYSARELEAYREIYRDNCRKIKSVGIWLKVFLISLIIIVAGLAFLIIEAFQWVAMVGVAGLVISSIACAIITGYFADVPQAETGDGAGCAAVLVLPIYFIMNAFFALTGWFFGIREKKRMQEENKQLYARFGDEIL